MRAANEPILLQLEPGKEPILLLLDEPLIKEKKAAKPAVAREDLLKIPDANDARAPKKDKPMEPAFTLTAAPPVPALKREKTTRKSRGVTRRGYAAGSGAGHQTQTLPRTGAAATF